MRMQPFKVANESQGVGISVLDSSYGGSPALGARRRLRDDAPPAAMGGVSHGNAGVGGGGQIVMSSFCPIRSGMKVADDMVAWRPDSEFDTVQLAKGQAIELDTTNDAHEAKERAKDKLSENPSHYKAMPSPKG